MVLQIILGNYTFTSSISTLPHKEVLAKISPTESVFVDKPLKDVVEILNQFKNIHTFESCQGNKDFAQIWIEGNGIYDFAEKLSSWLAHKIKQKNLDITSPEYQLDFSIQWDGNKDTPYLLLQFPNNQVESVTRIFCRVRTESIDDT